MGAGREKKDDQIDYNSGIILNKKVGDKIDKNEILGVLYSRNISKIKQAEETFRKSFIISDEKPKT